MNTINSTSSALSDWATLAAHEFEAEIERVRALPSFQQFLAETLESQGGQPGEKRQGENGWIPIWNERDCVRVWIRDNPITVSEPPLARPSWATERKVSPDWAEQLMWDIEDTGHYGSAKVVRSVTVEPDGSMTGDTGTFVAFTDSDGDRVTLEVSELAETITALTAAQKALAAE